MWVLNQKVVVTQSINTVESSNKNEALLIDIRKKDIINNITTFMTFMMLEPLNCLPLVCESDFQLSGGVFQLSGSYVHPAQKSLCSADSKVFLFKKGKCKKSLFLL